MVSATGPICRIPGLFCGLAALGCGSASFDGRSYSSAEVAFHVGPVPAGWRIIEVDEALVAFRNDAARATVMVNGRCGRDADDVPLGALTRHLFLQFTGKNVMSEATVKLDGREALRTEISAALDGVKKHYVAYVLKKNGCVYDLVQVAAARNAGEVGAFDEFARGFATAGEAR